MKVNGKVEMMKKILVNDMLREFVDPKEFFVRRYDENMRNGKTECFGLRQTGRTTRMIVETIQKVVENPEEKFIILTHNSMMGKRVVDLVNHYKYQMDVQIPGDSINVYPGSDFNLIETHRPTVLRDNGITDVNIQREISRDFFCYW